METSDGDDVEMEDEPVHTKVSLTSGPTSEMNDDTINSMNGEVPEEEASCCAYSVDEEA